MKIILAKVMGHCFGVTYALNQALQLKNKHKLTIIGQLVHNPQTVRQLDNYGIFNVDDINDVNAITTKHVMITAHGTSIKNKKILKKNGFLIEDATCPLVLKVHKTVKKMVEKGYFPVVIGHPEHVEVKGIVGDLKQYLVLCSEKDLIKLKQIDSKQIGIVSQTTNQVEFVENLVNQIRSLNLFEKIEFVNTICKPTRERQKAAKDLAEKVELMIVIGGYNSSNTKKLVEICTKKVKKVYHIEKETQLKSHWFYNVNIVGVTAGASTPDNIIEAVHTRLQVIAKKLLIANGKNQLLDYDLKRISQLGLSKGDIQKQVKLIKHGNQTAFTLLQIASLNHGIISLSSKQLNDYINIYLQSSISKVKFVPASGAATRMFQELSSYLNIINNHETDQYLNIFIKNIKKFAFYDDLKQVLNQDNLILQQLLIKKQYKLILTYLLTDKGLNYANLPKGLIKFHKYKKYSLTAFEEHLIEGLKFLPKRHSKKQAKVCRERVKIHLTVNKDNRKQFKRVFQASVLKILDTIDISFSTQKESTNIIALDVNNQLVRDHTGQLLLRQAGHGALIQNLNKLASQSSIIFIKNIDNIMKESGQNSTVIYQQAFAGILIKIQEDIFKYLKILISKKKIEEIQLNEIMQFCESKLNFKSEDDILKYNYTKKVNILKYFLNRPLRICGLVKNSGQTGGLPFWVKDIKGSMNLQIIEGSQLNIKLKRIAKMVKESTHFNPVFMVCGVNNFKGRKFNLFKFINPDTRIITQKNYFGKIIKIMELPGLWNGGMYYWNTIFVEMPKQTFAPVKSVIDLLDKRH